MLTRICTDGRRLFVTDRMWHRVNVINIEDGSRVLTIGEAALRTGSGSVLGQFHSPHGICLSPNGDEIFVVDSGDNSNGIPSHVVQVFRAADGLPIRSFGSEHFRKPRDICISQDGEVFVTDHNIYGNFRIQVFDLNGVFKRTNKLCDNEFYHGICTSGDNLFAATDNHIIVFNVDGTCKWEYIGDSPRGGICVVNDRLFSINQHQIDVFNAAEGREHIRQIKGDFGHVVGVCVSPDGKEMFAAIGTANNNQIKVFQL